MTQTLMERARYEQRMSRERLVELIDQRADDHGGERITLRTIRKLESGQVAKPRDETLFAIADALKLDPLTLREDFASRTVAA